MRFARCSRHHRPTPFSLWPTSRPLPTRQETKAFNQPLGFNTSSVTNMGWMFKRTEAFNQPLHFSDTSSVAIMKNMFAVLLPSLPCTLLGPAPHHSYLPSRSRPTLCPLFDSAQGASTFNQPLNFDTSSVSTMEEMFLVRSAPALIQF